MLLRLLIGFSMLTASLAARSEDRGLEHKSRADIAMSNHAECIVQYGKKYALSTATPTEIAAGASAECEKFMLEFHKDMLAFGRANVSEEHARKLADDAAAIIRSRTEGVVINAVLRFRATPDR